MKTFELLESKAVPNGKGQGVKKRGRVTDPLADTFGEGPDGVDYCVNINIDPPLPDDSKRGLGDGNWERLNTVVEDAGFKVDTYSEHYISLDSYDPVEPEAVREVLRLLRRSFRKHRFEIADQGSLGTA